MKKFTRLICLPLVAAAVLSGCATAPQKPVAAASASAESAIAQGNLVFAAQEYERLAKANRKLREYYTLLAAEAWRDEGEFGEVRRVLAELKRKRLTEMQNTQVDLLLAEALLQEGEFEQADALLTVPEASVPESDRSRYLELKAKALGGSGRIADAVAVRKNLHTLLDDAERRDNEAAALALLSKAKPELLQSELHQLDASDLRRPWLEKSLRDRGLIPARAPLQASRAVGAWQTGSDGQLFSEGYANPGNIALLLPLSGEFATAGKAVRDGFMTAWFAAPQSSGTKVHVYDSGADRASLLLAIDAAIKDGARTLVGPLERNQVEVLFTNLPAEVRVLALNHPDMNPVPPSGQFQFGLSPEEEAALAAEQLFNSGVRRSVAIVSQEEWAERAGKAFTAQFTALGGQVLGMRGVAPAAVKFTEELDALLGEPRYELEPSAAPTLDESGNPVPAPKPRLLPVVREGGAEALFVAIRGPQGRMLMPQLRVRGQDSVIVLATSHVSSGSGNTVVDRDLEGISFLDAPFLFDSNTAVGVSREQLATELPSAQISARLFAFGIDAYRLLPYLDFLRNHQGTYLDGATGQLLIDAFGRIRRLSSGYRFRNGAPELSTALLPASGVSAAPSTTAAEVVPATAQ
jgi:uncharacterized protein